MGAVQIYYDDGAKLIVLKDKAFMVVKDNHAGLSRTYRPYQMTWLQRKAVKLLTKLLLK